MQKFRRRICKPRNGIQRVYNEREEAHAGILKNFAGAILYGEELLSPGYDGIN